MFTEWAVEGKTHDFLKGNQQSRLRDFSVRVGEPDIWKQCINSKFSWKLWILNCVSIAWVKSFILIISEFFITFNVLKIVQMILKGNSNQNTEYKSIVH